MLRGIATLVLVILLGIPSVFAEETWNAGGSAPMVTEDFWGVDAAVSRNQADDAARAATDVGGGGPSGADLRKTTFFFDASQLSPSNQSYRRGTGNIQTLLSKIANFLLVVVSTWAVLFIAVGGFMMAVSAGDSDRATKGRTIITYNLQALVVAMLAYGIVQFVLWVVWN